MEVRKRKIQMKSMSFDESRVELNVGANHTFS